jgi:peptide chain release factor 1
LKSRAGAGGDEAGILQAICTECISVLQNSQNGRGYYLILATAGVVIKRLSLWLQEMKPSEKLKYESGVHRVQRVPDTESQVAYSYSLAATLPFCYIRCRRNQP